MRHKVAGRSLNRSSSHRRSLFRNLVTDILRYEKVTTTEAKAKEVRGLAERMITLAKGGGLHCRRQALSYVIDEQVVEKLFNELAVRYAERPGGYTRITKIGARLGDSAPMVRLELVQ
ncbi:50S ribosomal protein L17 [Chloroflexota bacterium]